MIAGIGTVTLRAPSLAPEGGRDLKGSPSRMGENRLSGSQNLLGGTHLGHQGHDRRTPGNASGRRGLNLPDPGKAPFITLSKGRTKAVLLALDPGQPWPVNWCNLIYENQFFFLFCVQQYIYIYNIFHFQMPGTWRTQTGTNSQNQQKSILPP